MLQASDSLLRGQKFGSPLSSIFPLTKLLGLLITSQIAAMLSSDRLARVHGESIPWSSTSFMATVWLKPNLRNISSTSSRLVGSRFSAAGAHLAGGTVSSSPTSFCLLAPLGYSSSSPLSWSSPSGYSGTSYPSWLPSSLHDEVMRFMLLVGLDLISPTSYVEGVQAVVSLATQAALVECYGRWSLFCSFEQFDNVLHHQHNLPCFLLLAKMGKIFSLFTICDS